MTRRLRSAALLATITAALLVPGRAALANDFCNDTLLAPGVYTLLHDHDCPAGTAITIQADGVTLDLGGFTVDGLGTASVGIKVSTAAEGTVIRNGTLRGFPVGIEAGGTAGGQCFVGSSDDLAVDDVVVEDVDDYGMWLCSSGSSTVTGSTVSGTTSTSGAGIWASHGVDIGTSVVEDTAGPGIVLVANDTFDSLAVRDSIVRGFGIRGIDVVGLGEGEVEISDTTVAGCTVVSCRGIHANGETSVLISRTIVRDVDFGIEARDNEQHAFTVEDSLLRRIGRDGIVADNIFLPVVIRTVIRGAGSGAGDAGIRFGCTLTGVVRDSLVRGVTGDGIVVDESPGTPCSFGSDATLVRDNVVVGSTGTGIVLAEGPDYQVIGNTVSLSGIDGFLVDATATGAVLTDNRALRNVGDGFQLDTTDVSVTGNIARRNTGFGFRTVGPVATDGGNLAADNTAGDCSDPSHLPNTTCGAAPPPPPGAGIALSGAAISGSTAGGTDIVLPSWTPASYDLILVSVATRDETGAVTVTGNGLSWVEIANVDNVQGQGGVALFRAQGPSPTTGSITVTIGGNSNPAVAIAQRFSGVDTTTPVEAVATNAGPATDNDDMLQSVTTQTADAFAVAASWQRIATLTLPAGETAILLNEANSSTLGSMWYEGPVATPAATQLGATGDLSNTNDWSMIVVSLRPAP